MSLKLYSAHRSRGPVSPETYSAHRSRVILLRRTWWGWELHLTSKHRFGRVRVLRALSARGIAAQLKRMAQDRKAVARYLESMYLDWHTSC